MLISICKKIVYGGLGILAILFIIGFITGLVQGLQHPISTIATPATVAPSLTQDPVLVSDAQELGIDYSNINMSFAPSLTATDINGGYQTIGTFQAPNIIQILSGQTKQNELTTLAYEYLHYVWINTSMADRQQMTTLYQQYYDSNYDFQQLTAPYTGTPDIIANERNSTACTLVIPGKLTDAFNTYCNSIVPNRDILFE